MKALFVADDFKCDPLGIAWLSAYLKDAGHETDVATPTEAMSLSYEPDMLCYSVTTGNHVYYRKANHGLRHRYPDAVSVFGGAHVTFFPEYIDGKYMDMGVRGEGFEAIVDIANSVEKSHNSGAIANVVSNGAINPLRPLMPKDGMLLPDRDLIYRENRDKPIKSIMASFGCPNECPYCFNRDWKKMYDSQKVVLRPVQDILAEIEDLRRYPLKLLYFEDDVFPVYSGAWLDEFCAEYDTRLPFHIHLRAEYITDDAIRRLKEAGLHSVTYAIESGNEALRRTVLNRKMSDETIIEAASILQKYGINFRTQNMIGIPHESWHTALETLDLNIRCRPTMGWASIYQPYPGTELGQLCVDEGVFDGSIDDITPSFFDEYRLDVPYKKRYERLQKLFGFAVRHPGIGRRVVPLLARLPFGYSATHNRYKRKLNQELYEVSL